MMDTEYPEGIAIFEGHHNSADLSGLNDLRIFDPDLIYLGPIPIPVSSYRFKPQSDVCDLFVKGNPTPALSEMSLKSMIVINGYWSADNPALFNFFSPGEYTVVAGDNWGKLVILYFIVQPEIETSYPVRIVSLTGPVPSNNPTGPKIGITVQNTHQQPVTELFGAIKTNLSFSFLFSIGGGSGPLDPGKTTSASTVGLAGSSLNYDTPYPVTIFGKFQDGTPFNYTQMVEITPFVP